jgi:hypothetical protein
MMQNDVSEKTLTDITRAYILAGVDPPISYRAFPLTWAAAEQARQGAQLSPAATSGLLVDAPSVPDTTFLPLLDLAGAMSSYSRAAAAPLR